MKKYALVCLLLMPYAAFASETVTIVSKEPKYKTVYNTETVEVCEEYTVPIYDSYVEYPSDGQVIGGTIVGAAIGNQFGNGDGRDVMTVLGALAGGNMASKPRVRENIVDYERRVECHYEDEVVASQVKIGYSITYEQNGKFYKGFMNTEPRIGDKVRIEEDY